MASVKTIGLGWKIVPSALSTDLFFPGTGWFTAAMLGGWPGSARAKMEMRGRYGNALIVPAYQTANDTDNPDMPAIAIPVAVGAGQGYANADGVFYFTPTPATLSLLGSANIRFGWMIKLASGSNGGGAVSGSIDLLY